MTASNPGSLPVGTDVHQQASAFRRPEHSCGPYLFVRAHDSCIHVPAVHAELRRSQRISVHAETTVSRREFVGSERVGPERPSNGTQIF